mmetsp:Transcript_19029/g.63733  ORF Transcript_19029/g.63733 Transcript_19029/m.63733 type:complete len:368 (+) Transcript_19029:246-1349(+)
MTRGAAAALDLEAQAPTPRVRTVHALRDPACVLLQRADDQEGGVVGLDGLALELALEQAHVPALPHVAHNAPLSARAPGDGRKPNAQGQGRGPVVHAHHGDGGGVEGLIQELPGRVHPIPKRHGFVGLQVDGPAPAMVGLINKDGLLVSNQVPDGGVGLGVGHVVGEGERGAGHAPGGEVRPVLRRREPLAVPEDAHLEHIAVGPAAREGQVPYRGGVDGLEVTDHGVVAGRDVRGGAVEVEGAPVPRGQGAAPVAVLDDHGAPGLVQQPRPEVEVELRGAPVELDAVKLELHERVHVPEVAPRPLAVVPADAVVEVPRAREAQPVREAGHSVHVGEPGPIYNGRARGVVKGVPLGAIGPTGLPRVV